MGRGVFVLWGFKYNIYPSCKNSIYVELSEYKSWTLTPNKT